MRKIKRYMIAFTTFIGGAYFFLEYILPKTLLSYKFGTFHQEIIHGVRIVGFMAIGFGLIKIVQIHAGKLTRKEFNSLALLIGLCISLIAGIGNMYGEEKLFSKIKPLADIVPFASRVINDSKADIKLKQEAIESIISYLYEKQRQLAKNEGPIFAKLKNLENPSKIKTTLNTSIDHCLGATKSLKNSLADDLTKPDLSSLSENCFALYQVARIATKSIAKNETISKSQVLLYNGFFVPLGAAMFSILAFYIAGAAWRSFRLKSVEAGLMMMVAIIIILGQIPHGPLYISEDLPAIRLWLMGNLSVPATRAIFFGASIAGLALAIRIWLSLEKSPTSMENEQL